MSESPWKHGWTVNVQVVALVNNGKGEFMVAVKPKAPLCDGTFHKISGKFLVTFQERHRSETATNAIISALLLNSNQEEECCPAPRGYSRQL